jgi:hypothetical protein
MATTYEDHTFNGVSSNHSALTAREFTDNVKLWVSNRCRTESKGDVLHIIHKKQIQCFDVPLLQQSQNF